MIDWDTAGLALAKRDLWLATADVTRRCQAFTLSSPGAPVSGAAMQMCQMRWSLDDMALAIRDSRAERGLRAGLGDPYETIGEIA